MCIAKHVQVVCSLAGDLELQLLHCLLFLLDREILKMIAFKSVLTSIFAVPFCMQYSTVVVVHLIDLYVVLMELCESTKDTNAQRFHFAQMTTTTTTTMMMMMRIFFVQCFFHVLVLCVVCKSRPGGVVENVLLQSDRCFRQCLLIGIFSNTALIGCIVATRWRLLSFTAFALSNRFDWKFIYVRV
ncbi:hypothetical protein T4D_15533 [Trichinella pseudospiralis]|uniref:Uncharacterized protein n=1 Tax=Trichinella pseudospiralis TaxID=6337 RepID=A0A0V1FWK2_TRIPS|nr:hypothetical protein T4D_15533 [Trichinella pseudospiralis]